MISLVNVNRSFEGLKALDSLTLTVPKGRLYGLIGPGGSGKSTLCKVITGLLPPDSGVVIVGGVDVIRSDCAVVGQLQQSIGMLFQNDALFEHMNVLHNVEYPLKRAGQLSVADVRLWAMEQLAMVGLSGFETQVPSELSGGQRRRVALARACVTKPEILICDEPTAGLDPVTSKKILEMIAGIHYQLKNTVLVVSSDVLGLLATAQRSALLWQGRVLAEGSSKELWESDSPEIKRFLEDARLPVGVNTWQ